MVRLCFFAWLRAPKDDVLDGCSANNFKSIDGARFIGPRRQHASVVFDAIHDKEAKGPEARLS